MHFQHFTNKKVIENLLLIVLFITQHINEEDISSGKTAGSKYAGSCARVINSALAAVTGSRWNK